MFGDGANEIVALWHVWSEMHARCHRTTHRLYSEYGGRGIAVDPRWSDFERFLKDMGPRPAGMTLERVDNNGGYTPSNCVWASRAQQIRNTRRTILIEIDGRQQCLKDWCDEFGVKPSTVSWRVRCCGMTYEQALKSGPMLRGGARARQKNAENLF